MVLIAQKCNMNFIYGKFLIKFVKNTNIDQKYFSDQSDIEICDF